MGQTAIRKEEQDKKTLFQLLEFWLAIIFPLLIGIIVSIPICHYSELSLDLTYHGFNAAIEIFKVPLGISALCFPLVALVVSNHRSVQTCRQIIAFESQNSFSNYHKHREEFIKMLQRLESEQGVEFFKSYYFYNMLFPNNSIHYVSVFSEGKDGEVSVLVSILNQFEKLIEIPSNSEIFPREVEEYYMDLWRMSCKLHFEPKETIPCQWTGTTGIGTAYSSEKPLRHQFLIYRVLEIVGGFCNVDCNSLNCYGSAPTNKFKSIAQEIFNPPLNTATKSILEQNSDLCLDY
jgi:hypothetical protein